MKDDTRGESSDVMRSVRMLIKCNWETSVSLSARSARHFRNSAHSCLWRSQPCRVASLTNTGSVSIYKMKRTVLKAVSLILMIF